MLYKVRSAHETAAMKFNILTATLLVLIRPSLVPAEDWPGFLGPRGDGTSLENNVNLDWPETGPAVLWKVKVGTGYSAPSVLGDRVVCHHRERQQEVVECVSAKDGSQLWSFEYKSTYVDKYNYNNGPRCSPVLTDRWCFTLGPDGHLTCLDITSGQKIWQNHLPENYELPDWFFGVGCTPILDGDTLYVLVGGQPNSGVVAFDAASGKVKWEAGGRDTWQGVIEARSGQPYQWKGDEQVVSYSSPLIAQINGRKHLLCLMRQGLLSLDPSTGKKNFAFWFRATVHESVNAARPIVVGNRILLSAAYRQGSVVLEVQPDGKSVTTVWENRRSLAAHWSTPIHVDGFVYGFSGRNQSDGELRCIDFETGELKWSTSGWEGSLAGLIHNRGTGEVIQAETGKPVPPPYFGRGSLIKVGDRFIALGEEGTLSVVEIRSDKFAEACRCSFDEIGYPAWAAPVLSNGRLLLRSEKWMVCLDLRAQQSQTPPPE